MAKQKVPAPSFILQSLLEEYQITPAQLASDIQMSLSSTRSLVSGKKKIGVQDAFRLAKYFGKPMQFWTDLQLAYDVNELKGDPDFKEILKEIPKAKKKKGSAAAGVTKPKKPETAEKKTAPRGRPKMDKSAKPDKTAKQAKKKGAAADDSPPSKASEGKALDSTSRPTGRRGRPRKRSTPLPPEPVEITKPKPNTILIKKGTDSIPSSSETQEIQSSDPSLSDPFDF
ncbi:MAG: hypothetical protein LBD47_02295 [Treponema sp.]|jgi:addiction module HigA family antidote|nr:hypothetical protein [Treponema sp.]